MKRFLRKIHLYFSLICGLFFIILCLTGAILVFQTEIQQIINPDFFYVKNYEGKKALPVDSLLSIADKTIRSEGKTLESAQFYSQPDKTCEFKVSEVKGVFLAMNPYTGEITGKGTPASSFFFTVRCLHRWLLFTPDGWPDRQTGKKIMGTVSVLISLVLISGFLFVIPKKLSLWKNLFVIKKEKNKFLFWFTSHRSLGMYSLLFLLLMSLTGPIWSFESYRKGVAIVFGVYDGKETKGKSSGGPKKATQPDVSVWAEACRQIMTEVPDYKSLVVQNNRVNVVTDYHKNSNTSDSYRFDENGKILSKTDREELSGNRKMMRYAFMLHTGNWGGIVVKFIYFISCIIGVYLMVSGMVVWMKKKNFHNDKC
ncbi:MAG: PepSY-associated TM helix domain-containing protein [Parabacteroides sp.]|nr:PepSY-associated TM helix domain-containing protein [Parabacteroides sp.]